MALKRQKRSICFLAILLSLFFGMCADNIRTDSSFLYASTAESDANAGNASRVFAIRSPESQGLLQQIYDSESSRQGETAFVSDRTIRRSGNQASRGRDALLGAVILSVSIFGIFSSAFRGVFRGAVSNTVIIMDYIHRQDGQKAPSFLYSA